MRKSGRIALAASVIWVVVVWCVWLATDYRDGETQIAMVTGLIAITGIKLILGRFID